MALEDWKKLVVAPVAQLLKERGFRKSGVNFSARCPGVTLMVGLQSSTSSTQNALKVTCNLGISVHQLAGRSNASIHDAHWNERIGHFLAEPQDHWWTCGSEAEAISAGNEIASLLEKAALPEMERLASPAAIAALWASGRSPGLTDRRRRELLALLIASGVAQNETPQ
jgi:hypothetical protein